MAPKIPAIYIHPHKVNLEPHVGIQMTIEENENVDTDTDAGNGPVPNIIDRSEVHTQYPRYHSDDFEPGLVVPPVLPCMYQLHRPNIPVETQNLASLLFSLPNL